MASARRRIAVDAAVTARRAVDATASLAPPMAPSAIAIGPSPLGAFAFFVALGFFGAGVGVDAALDVDDAGVVITVSSSLVSSSSASASSSSSSSPSSEALSNASSSSSDRASICSSVSASQGLSDVEASSLRCASGFLKSQTTGSSALDPPAPISPSRRAPHCLRFKIVYKDFWQSGFSASKTSPQVPT